MAQNQVLILGLAFGRSISSREAELDQCTIIGRLGQAGTDPAAVKTDVPQLTVGETAQRPAPKATAGKSLAQTTDRRVAHVIGASDLGKHFSRFPASKGFPALMAG